MALILYIVNLLFPFECDCAQKGSCRSADPLGQLTCITRQISDPADKPTKAGVEFVRSREGRMLVQPLWCRGSSAARARLAPLKSFGDLENNCFSDENWSNFWFS